MDRGQSVGERPNRGVQAGVLHSRGQLSRQAGGQAQIAHGPWMGSAVDHQQHPEHLPGDPARHAGQAHDTFPVGDRADLFRDRVRRVVQRNRHKRALGPALHDRLQRRDRVAVESVENIVRYRAARGQDKRVIGLLTPECGTVGDEDELDGREHLVEETLPRRPFGLTVEQLGAE